MVFGVVVLTFVALLIIGLRWGFTPMPKPPPGVRLQPLSPPLKAEALATTNAAFCYVKAASRMQGYKQSEQSNTQMKEMLAAELPNDTRALEQTLGDYREALDLVRQGASLSSCQMP